MQRLPSQEDRELSGDSAWTSSEQGFLASGEKRSVPSRLGVTVVGLGSRNQVGQSVCLGGFVEVEDDGEVLGVEVDHHEEQGQEHCSIHVSR